MKAEFKQKWIEALRSGRFKQTKQVLKCDGAYCCLGVLQTVSREMGTAVSKDPGDEYLRPTTALKKLGLDFQDQVDLAAMNDEGKSFKEIADYIEEKL